MKQENKGGNFKIRVVENIGDCSVDVFGSVGRNCRMIDYKEEIKKLLEKVDDYYDLKRTYKLLEYLYLEEVLKTVK